MTTSGGISGTNGAGAALTVGRGLRLLLGIPGTGPMSGRITLVGLMGATSNIALGNTPDTNPLLLRASLNISALAMKMSAGVLLHDPDGGGPLGSREVDDPEPVTGYEYLA